ncbi:MAG: aspartate kinase [Bacteroidia bacterium]
MKVLKFGGTSVGSAERMKSVANLVVNDAPKIVVLSAMSGTTNSLVEICNALYNNDKEIALEIINVLEEKYKMVMGELYTTDAAKSKALNVVNERFSFIRDFTGHMFTAYGERAILAQGELLSTHLFQYYLEETGVDSSLIQALDFMRIDENDEPDLSYISSKLKETLKQHARTKLFVTQGFICTNHEGEIDNLKRGGSDYSASLIGAAIDAEEIQIWTDIDGMHNNDPRVVKNTHPIAELSFDEAAELAYFGAKILHPSTVLPAKQRNIPVRILNTMEPEAHGTVITHNTTTGSIKAVAAKDGIVAIKIKSGRMLLAYGFLSQVFEIFERYRTPIDVITTSEVALSVTIDNTKHLDDIVLALESFCNVEVDYEQTIICVVGDFSAEQQGYAFQVLEALKDVSIRMISYGGSEHNITVLINSKDKVRALNALNEGLF